MLSQSSDGLQWKLWAKLKIPAAYGPVLRKFESDISFPISGRSQKSDSLYDYDTLYEVWMNRMKIGRGAEFLNIVKLELLQSAPNNPKPNWSNRASKVLFICAL